MIESVLFPDNAAFIIKTNFVNIPSVKSYRVINTYGWFKRRIILYSKRIP